MTWKCRGKYTENAYNCIPKLRLQFNTEKRPMIEKQATL